MTSKSSRLLFTDNRGQMALLDILKFPDPRLRKKSIEVESVSKEHQGFIDAMLETMYSFNGIGLAAPQVNRLDRIIVIDTRPRDESRYKPEDFTDLESKIEQPLILINPEILESEGNITYDEGCLSVPSYFEAVKRFEKIKIKALNKKGEEIQLETDGLLSICIQHENDHLDGIVFIDRLSSLKKGFFKKKLLKAKKAELSAKD